MTDRFTTMQAVMAEPDVIAVLDTVFSNEMTDTTMLRQMLVKTIMSAHEKVAREQGNDFWVKYAQHPSKHYPIRGRNGR